MINIRKLVAIDLLLHGPRFIIIEFALGIVFLLAFGMMTLYADLAGRVRSSWGFVLGFWLVAMAVNYIPLFIYAVQINRNRTAKQEGEPELANVKRYSVQQVVILIPFLVMALALLQEFHSRQK